MGGHPRRLAPSQGGCPWSKRPSTSADADLLLRVLFLGKAPRMDGRPLLGSMEVSPRLQASRCLTNGRGLWMNDPWLSEPVSRDSVRAFSTSPCVRTLWIRSLPYGLKLASHIVISLLFSLHRVTRV